MSAPVTGRDPAHEVDLLAPWVAIDRLDEADAAALERLLADDPDLAARLDFAAEERDDTVALNEALPVPSRAAREKLFAAIDAHEARRAPVSRSVMTWLSGRIAAFSPQTLAWAATAAALVIVVQAGVLTGTMLGGKEAAYETASDGAAQVEGPTALVGFQPAATAADVAKTLADAKAEIVGGPKPGGVFVVRFAGASTPEAREAALKRLRDASAVVKFASPGGQ